MFSVKLRYLAIMNRNYLFVSIILSLYGSVLSGQEEIFQQADTGSSYSGFASVFVIPTSLSEQNAVYMGGIGSVIISDRIIVGGYGMRKTGKTYADKGALNGKMMSFGSAGLIGGYTFPITKRIKPVFQCFAGWAGLTLSSTDSKGYAITEAFNRLGVISPSVSVDFNLFWSLWLSAGFEYMFVGGVSIDGYSDSDFSKPGAYISLKLMTGDQ